MNTQENFSSAAATAPARDYMEQPPVENVRRDVDRRATRWVVFVGDVLPDNFKRSYEKMQMGGEHFGQDFKTLNLTKGLLRRCQLTPLTVGRDYLNDDALGDQKDKAIPETVFDNINQRPVTRYYVECLPGDELSGILSSQQGDGDMGIREVESLRGVSVAEMDARNLQRTIFPKWDLWLEGREEMPTTLASLETYLHGKRAETNDPIIREIIGVFLQSAAQYRRWGTTKLGQKARLVKAPPTEGGKVYSWEEIDLELFDQLELNREEFLMRKQDKPEPQSAPRIDRDDEMAELRQMIRDQNRTIQLLLNRLPAAAENPAQAEVGRQTTPQPEPPPPAAHSPVNYSEQSCAGLNARGEECKARVVKEVDGLFFCTNHPKAE